MCAAVSCCSGRAAPAESGRGDGEVGLWRQAEEEWKRGWRRGARTEGQKEEERKGGTGTLRGGQTKAEEQEGEEKEHLQGEGMRDQVR